jgi:hypothetical protein
VSGEGDFDQQFRERFMSYLDEGESRRQGRPLVVEARRSSGSRLGRGLSVATLTAAAVLLVAAIAVRLPPGTSGPGNSPVTPSVASSETAATPTAGPTTGPSMTPAPTLSTPTAWALGQVAPPPGHPAFIVLETSLDASVIEFRDRGLPSSLFLQVGPAVEEVQIPGRDPQTNISGSLSGDGEVDLVYASNKLWRYDVHQGAATPLPASPDGLPIQSFQIIDAETAVVLTGNIQLALHPNTVWSINLATGKWTRAAKRTNAITAFVTTRGIVLVVDLSKQQDLSKLAFYLVAPDGSDAKLASLDMPSAFVVSPDGRYLAYSVTDTARAGVWLLRLGSTTATQLTTTGTVTTFSPDSSQVEVVHAPDGNVEGVDRQGRQVTTAPSVETAQWLPVR